MPYSADVKLKGILGEKGRLETCSKRSSLCNHWKFDLLLGITVKAGISRQQMWSYQSPLRFCVANIHRRHQNSREDKWAYIAALQKEPLLLPEHQGEQAEIFQGHSKERWRSISKSNRVRQNCKQNWKHGLGKQHNRREISTSNEGMSGPVSHDAKGHWPPNLRQSLIMMDIGNLSNNNVSW